MHLIFRVRFNHQKSILLSKIFTNVFKPINHYSHDTGEACKVCISSSSLPARLPKFNPLFITITKKPEKKLRLSREFCFAQTWIKKIFISWMNIDSTTTLILAQFFSLLTKNPVQYWKKELTLQLNVNSHEGTFCFSFKKSEDIATCSVSILTYLEDASGTATRLNWIYLIASSG